MLIKGKSKAQGFCSGGREGKNTYLKNITSFRAMYFLAGLTLFVIICYTSMQM